MGYLKEKVAYISGLMAGMDYKPDTKEGKIFNAMLELMDEMAISVEEHDEMLDDVSDCLDGVLDDVELLEDYVFDLDEDDDVDDDEYCDFDDLSSLKCTSCGDNIYFDPELVESVAELLCPSCNAKIPFNK